MSPAFKYRALRTSLVLLRRIARRYHINFDNAVESSAKAVADSQRACPECGGVFFHDNCSGPEVPIPRC